MAPSTYSSDLPWFLEASATLFICSAHGVAAIGINGGDKYRSFLYILAQ